MITVFDNTKGNASATYDIGNPAPGGNGAWALQISGGGTYSITFTRRVDGSAAAGVSAAYATSAAPLTYVTTAITAAANIVVPCPGNDLLVVVSYTSGALLIEAEPVQQ